MNVSLIVTIITLLMSSSVLVAVIGIIREALAWRREQKSKGLDNVIADYGDRLKRIEQNQEIQQQASKYILYDRISHLGREYIYAKEVDYDDRRILNDMHNVYHNGLKGNGDLDVLMNEVNRLPLKIEK